MDFRTIGATVFLGACLLASGAQAHAHLMSADPAGNSVLHGSPKALSATFSEPLVVTFSWLGLSSARSGVIPTGKTMLAPTDRHTLVAPLLKPLEPGDYMIHWNAVSTDTHRTSGSYTFRVEP